MAQWVTALGIVGKSTKRGANTGIVTANEMRAKGERGWEGRRRRRGTREEVGGVDGGRGQRREWESGGWDGSCQVTQTPLGSLIKFSTFPHSH